MVEIVADKYLVKGSALYWWWGTTLVILSAFTYGWDSARILGILSGILFAWAWGGLAFKHFSKGTIHFLLLLHPPFLWVWPSKFVRKRHLSRMWYWLLVEEIPYLELRFRPWPIRFFLVEIPPLLFPHFHGKGG